jgi:GTPase SAR1 family protein
MGGRTFAEGRERLRDRLASLSDLADKRGSPRTAEAVRLLDKKLVEERFQVVVLGEFKRGKTTFVNALLGAEMLPAAVVPLTSVITTVSWGEEVRARVSFEDGREEDIAASELARYVTQRENPENRLGVRRALLFYPSEDLRDGVLLVDTPGVGSVFRRNTEVAREFLPEADAAVFLTSADPPISETERVFLHEVRAEAARMFFVLNKVDYLSEPDRQEALAFTAGVLRDALGRDVSIYPVSARRALEAKLAGDAVALEASGFAAFERDFRAFLLREKGLTILASVAGRAERLVDDERNSIDVEQRALELSLDELDETKRRMENVFDRARMTRDDVRALLRAEAEELVRMVERDLEDLRTCEEERLRGLVAEQLAAHDDVRDLRGALDEQVKEALRTDLDRWRRDEDRRVGDAFRDSTRRFVAAVEHAALETVRLCGEILGLDLSSTDVQPDLPPGTRFTYSFFEVPTILESLLPDVRRFLPRATARRMIERDFHGEIPRLVDKHCGRLRYDFVQRLERARRELELSLDDRLEATIVSLLGGIERSERDRTRSDEEMREGAARAAAWRERLAELREVFAAAATASAPEEARR